MGNVRKTCLSRLGHCSLAYHAPVVRATSTAGASPVRGMQLLAEAPLRHWQPARLGRAVRRLRLVRTRVRQWRAGASCKPTVYGHSQYVVCFGELPGSSRIYVDKCA